MKRNIERYFLFLLFFIFTLSLLNITSTFALGKTADILPDTKGFLSGVKNLIPKGKVDKVDTEVCKKDTSKAGAEQFSTICKTQCTSTDPKFAQFKKDNKEACELLGRASEAVRAAASGSGTGAGGSDSSKKKETTPNKPPASQEDGTKKGEIPPKKGEPTIEEKAEIDKNVPVENIIPIDQVSGTDAGGASGGDDTKIPLLTEDDIKNANLSTKEAFDKIKEVFTVTVARIPHTDLNPVGGDAIFNDDNELTKAISFLGLVPVRVTIAAKADVTNPTLLEQLNQRILALAKNVSDKPTNLGASATTAPTPDSLYWFIYTQAISEFSMKDFKNIITTPNTEITSKDSTEILNAKVIAVRKVPESATDILLQLDGAEGYVSGFEKLSGVKLGYAHIVDPAAKNAAFVAKENFKEGLAPNTKAQDDCPIDTTLLFVDRLKAHPACRNLLKITVPTDTTAEFGIPNGVVLNSGDSTAAQKTAQADGDVKGTIFLILNLFDYTRKFTNYFNPDLASENAHYLYASEDIRNQLKNSKNVEGFRDLSLTHNWPASEYVQAAIATIPIQIVVFLLRVSGDPKSIYLTKNIEKENGFD